jgi:pSer/pThr/pTyr-binding forkhead associated (FHA) protein
MVGQDVYIEDQNSTNGTYINGRAVKKQLLQHNDTVEIGKYKIKYLVEDSADYEKTMVLKPGQVPSAAGVRSMPTQPAGMPQSNFGGLGSGNVPQASIKVLSGAAAGREVALTKVVTTVGKPGVQVASITKRPGGYVFAHVEGSSRPTVNGSAVQSDPVHLKDGDVIELAGTQMQFMQP